MKKQKQFNLSEEISEKIDKICKIESIYNKSICRSKVVEKSINNYYDTLFVNKVK